MEKEVKLRELNILAVMGIMITWKYLGMKMAEGKIFLQSNLAADSSSVIFNEAAIAAMGIKNPIGKTVSLWGHKKQIIGIVKEFSFLNLYIKKLAPAFLEYLLG